MQQNDRTRLHQLITTTRKMDAYSAVLALRECYETQYQIFNHDAVGQEKLHPMALVALHAKEDTFSYSLMHRFMWRFRQYEITKTWGYNLTDFLELPWHMTQAIFKIEQTRAAEQLKKDEALRRQEAQMLSSAVRNDHRYTPPTGAKR